MSSRPTSLFLRRYPNAAEAVVIWVVVFAGALLAAAFRQPGLTFDEAIYIPYGEVHLRWFTTLSAESFSREAIERYWGVGQEHPPLFPLAIGLTHAALGGHLGAIDLLAARGAGVVEYALLAAAVFLFVAGRWGRWAGRLAAVCLAAMPRVFADGQLATGDLPMALTWFLAVWAFVRAVERRGARREMLAGIAFGAALLTKFNALLLPLVVAPWALAFHRRRALRPLLITGLLGAAIFLAGWPWLWIDTVDHLREYLLRGTERARILVYYFHQAWRDVAVPWHYPLVMALVTVPVGVVCGAVWGAVGGLRTWSHGGAEALVGRGPPWGLTALLVANILLPLVIFALPSVPVYDGVRLFLHMFPFVACLAGIGGVAAIRFLRARGLPLRAAVGAVAALALVQVVPVIGTAPFGLSYYNLLVGGPAGAERLGFETTYWGEGMDPVFWRDLAARAPAESRVAINFIPAHQIRPFYDQEIRNANFQPVPYTEPRDENVPYDFLIVVCRQGYFDHTVWDLYRHAQPIAERRLRFFGSVPVCRVYDTRGWRGSTAEGSAR